MEAPLEKLQSALAGRYNVVREIGEGGMATVYLARDVKHDRHVALKLLKPELGAVLGVERFLSEIKVTAHLQHPHLLPLFDSGEAEGLLFYVMPFVEGESLRARLDREHQLPVDEALRITLAVASALDYAHKQGVIHRDLKPENILLQHGEPVVSDFGIALAVSKAGGARVTQTGLSLGTPQYMSPEQATGDRDVDARSDIYSLAAVAYEMLTGEPPHSGKTAQAIIARVLTEKAPSARIMRDTVPEHVDVALLKGLSKLPADRFASAAEFATALKQAGHGVSPAPFRSGSARAAAAPRSRLIAALPWALAAALGAAVVLRGPAPPPEQPVMRMEQPFDQAAGLSAEGSLIAVSPNGQAIAITPTLASQRGIMIRTLADTGLRELAGTEGGRLGVLTFSHDSREIAFARDGKIWRVGLNGARPRAVTDVPVGFNGLTWGADDQIVFGGRQMMVVSAGGGTPRAFAFPDSASGEMAIRQPRFLPDGKTLVAAIVSRGGGNRIGVVAMNGAITRLPIAGLAPRYVHPGILAYDDGNRNILAVQFDMASKRVTGDPVVVASDVPLRAAAGLGSWGASPNGTFVQFGSTSLRRLALVSRTGTSSLLLQEARYFRRPVASPLGDRLAVEITPTGVPGTASDVWIFNRSLGSLARLTIGLGAQDPMWMRDGRRVAFAVRDSSATGSGLDVWVQPADGSAPASRLSRAPLPQWPYGTSPDGNLLVVDQNPGIGRQIEIGVIDLTTNPDSVRPLLSDPAFANRLAQLSPDGKWLAYTSTRTGLTEVYVRPLEGGGNHLVSNSGGDQVLWNPNGRELFYRANGKVISATIRTSPQFEVTERRELFDDTYFLANSLDWTVLPSGNEFVMLKPEAAQRSLLITVNWATELRAKLQAQLPR